MIDTDNCSDAGSTQSESTNYTHYVVLNGPVQEPKESREADVVSGPTGLYFPPTLLEDEGWKPVGPVQPLSAFQIDTALLEIAGEEKKRRDSNKRLAEALSSINAKRAKVVSRDQHAENSKQSTPKVVIYKRAQNSALFEFGIRTKESAVMDKLGYPFVFEKTNAWIVKSLPAGLSIFTRNLQEPSKMVTWVLKTELLLNDKPFIADVVGANGYENSRKISQEEIFLDDSAIMILISGQHVEYLGTQGIPKGSQTPVFRMTETKKKMVASRVQRRRLNSNLTAIGSERVYVTVERELCYVNN